VLKVIQAGTFGDSTRLTLILPSSGHEHGSFSIYRYAVDVMITLDSVSMAQFCLFALDTTSNRYR
jgi:hypothetical protein